MAMHHIFVFVLTMLYKERFTISAMIYNELLARAEFNSCQYSHC